MTRKVLLAVLFSALVLALMLLPTTPALAAEAGVSDKFAQTLMGNSLKHYIQALIAYNDGDYGEAAGQLQAAASNAKHVDPELAGLLLSLREYTITSNPFPFTIASQVASMYNYYNELFEKGWPCLDPSNPTATPPGEMPLGAGGKEHDT